MNNKTQYEKTFEHLEITTNTYIYKFELEDHSLIEKHKTLILKATATLELWKSNINTDQLLLTIAHSSIHSLYMSIGSVRGVMEVAKLGSQMQPLASPRNNFLSMMQATDSGW